MDRYTIDGDYRQVMVSAREMEQHNLPPRSQTFVNRLFKYTHGYGITLATGERVHPRRAAQPADQGYPAARRNIRSLRIDRPQIYYGELTNTYVVVNAAERSSITRAARRTSTPVMRQRRREARTACGASSSSAGSSTDRLLFSDYPTRQSRIMFHRQVQERVAAWPLSCRSTAIPISSCPTGGSTGSSTPTPCRTITPTANRFRSGWRPRSRRSSRRSSRESEADYLGGVNYIRNSVKAVVDAFDGTVTFYVFDPTTRSSRSGSGFPGPVPAQGGDAARAARHVRYPEGSCCTRGWCTPSIT